MKSKSNNKFGKEFSEKQLAVIIYIVDIFICLIFRLHLVLHNLYIDELDQFDVQTIVLYSTKHTQYAASILAYAVSIFPNNTQSTKTYRIADRKHIHTHNTYNDRMNVLPNTYIDLVDSFAKNLL